MKMSDNLVDPLLVLLRRHEAANTAYDVAADSDASEAERNHLFAACGRTMQAIIDRAPAATTAEGAARCFFASLLRPRVTTSIALPRDDRTSRLRR
jgi:hypothetical protein